MDYRRNQRIVVDKEVECDVDGVRDFVFLYNLSVSGCMVEVSERLARVGSKMVFDLAGITDIEGHIVWQVGRNAGVAFDRMIPESVVEYLGFEPSLTPFAESQPRDRYGSPLPA